LRDHLLHALKLTTSLIKVRNGEELLSDMYPCIVCEDIEAIQHYKVRLIFGLKESYAVDFSGFKDQENAKDMFVLFKAWTHYNLNRIFTSLEIKHLYRYLAKDLEKLSFFGLLQEFVLVDPC
jgi:hypothetical protein